LLYIDTVIEPLQLFLQGLELFRPANPVSHDDLPEIQFTAFTVGENTQEPNPVFSHDIGHFQYLTLWTR